MTVVSQELQRGDASGGPARQLNVLFAMFQGGGNIALIMPVVKAAVARGHAVRVLAGPGVWPSRMPVSAAFCERIAGCGARYVAFTEPETHPLDTPPHMKGFAFGWTPRQLARVTWYVSPYRWSAPWAVNVAAELQQEPADIVVADFLLPGAVVAAEALAVPSISLVHGIYKHRPAPGLPPYGSGFGPAHGPLQDLRNVLVSAGIERVYARDALPALNRARSLFGLSPLKSMYDQFDRAARVLVLTERAFDFNARVLPTNVRYVGTPIDDGTSSAWHSPWREDDGRPLVVVSLSTLQQGQGPVLHRILTALEDLPIKALVTLGPALDARHFRAPPNVAVVPFVPHSAVLPRASAMITQCGIGGVTKALRNGVPLICMPLVGDQPDNAARVVAHGAGVRLGRDARTDQIRRALQQVLEDSKFREAARRLASKLITENPAETAVSELESVARMRAKSHLQLAARQSGWSSDGVAVPLENWEFGGACR